MALAAVWLGSQVPKHVDGLLVGVWLSLSAECNPAPGPKFDCNLHWFERLPTHARAVLDTAAPIALAGL
jgi:hypothetical protein